ncbi:hypothetical protein LPB260_28790 [Pseudomonas sp. LPB0260]|uniref:hypothetical protein n=1 Tax=Pseudomonas sp. LPB0260 TaxID=2614442 RepID=UPI0015C27F8B|nr:hypothetical protein [Pseudomonas sp. LPB0260]QLC74670.1 hypothetical protein LPB260_13840 [Pseudomonas sp. LPB0260]QLC77438.1 hypothetical protein LPB260_28790 [Pseudomonas sp. LPB0260]
MKAPVLLPLLLALAACGDRDGAHDARPEASLSERFYSGCVLPGEFLRPSDLPAIPPSFDEAVP